MADHEAKAAAAGQDDVSPAGEACDVAAVKRRAKAGLALVCVAVTVALVVLAGAAATLLATGIVPLSGFEGRITAAIEERRHRGEARS